MHTYIEKLHRIPYCIVQPRLHKKNKNDLIGTGNNEYKVLYVAVYRGSLS
jgi:hypothetical protein